jgi:hypothetical protein
MVITLGIRPHIYVTRSGKRYHLGKIFETALLVSHESSERQQYNDANPASVAHSYDIL